MDEYETVLMKELPESLRLRGIGSGIHGVRKWKWLHDKIVKITPDLPVARFRMANKKDAQSAQSTINGTTNGKKQVIPMSGYHFITRTEPVASKDGEYFLYVVLEPVINVK